MAHAANTVSSTAAAASWITAAASETLNPPQVEHALTTLAARWPADAASLEEVVREFPLGQAALLHLLAISSICAARLSRDPSLLLWLRDSEICACARSRNAMRAQLGPEAETTAIAADNFRPLRSWKGREMTRVALREVAGAATLPQTTAELTQIGEICVSQVYQHWHSELTQRRGTPASDFAIIGLGKVGGRELNHSSDIDVIFVYGDEGQVTPTLSYHQWFNWLAEKIVETFSSSSPAGALFRLDVRLRPEGTAGPLARSLESMENYYAGFGEMWERLALVKARGIAGSRELAYEFLRQHQPFIFPKSPSRDLLDDIAAIKRRIERDIVGHEKLQRDVKLGAGGIREVEFVVQALQLLHGARHTFLQESSTLRALPLLAELELLPGDEARQLQTAYYFLRTVEHRLQIEAEQQTHTIPDEPESLDRLSRSLDFKSADEFLAHLHQQMQNVRAIFERVIGESGSSSGVEVLNIFRNEAAAQKALAELGRSRSSFHVAPRTRQVFRRLRPLLLERLARCADADGTLNQFVRFVDAYGLRSMLFELLATHPRLLELLVKTFDASRYAGDLLIRRPQLLEEITRGDLLDRSFSAEDHLTALRRLNVDADALDPVRTYRHTQTLRILLRDVLELARLAEIHTELSALAEACVVFVNELRDVADLTIVAMGKFGGAEISYGADLDVIFVGGNTRAAQQLLVALAQPSAEGSIYTLDARLRPEGEQGDLVATVASLENYYATRAQLWEIQALTRARPIDGDAAREFTELAQRVWRQAGRRADLRQQIAAMVDRIRRERASAADELDYKTGTGGMIAAEFLVQALQMQHGIWQQQTQPAMQQLVAAKAITREDADELWRNYEFLRRIELVLRRQENRNVSSIPDDEVAQRQLAHRLESASLDELGSRYRAARHAILAICSRYFG